jgi:short-subunit dehydrogenase
MDLGLKGKVAVITGASVGIGLAVSEGLAAEGVNLVMVARQQERLHREAARLSEQFGVKSIGVPCDVATAAGSPRSLAALTRHSEELIFSSTTPALAPTRP